MSNLEKKREDFRKYLESAGAVDNLTRALIRLYEQKNKPEDPTTFLRKELCLSCHDEQEYEQVVGELNEANKKICELEREIVKLRDSIRRTSSETELALIEGLNDLQAAVHELPLKNILNKKVFDELKDLRTEFKGTLYDCLAAAFANLGRDVGIFACDPEAYSVFSQLFDPFIEHLHGLKIGQKHPDQNWGEPWKLGITDSSCIKAVEIRVSRNIAGLPFAPIMQAEHYEVVFEKLKNVVKCFCNGSLKGKLYPLEGMPGDVRKMLIEERKFFEKDDLLKDANAERFWPIGRAIYVSDSKNFFVWCNQKNHLKFIASNASCLKSAYELLIEGVTQVCKDIECVRDERLGFLTISPDDLGTALHATVRAKFTNFSQKSAEFEAIACQFDLKMEKVGENLCEISTKRCVGVSEFELLAQLTSGINELIHCDKSS